MTTQYFELKKENLRKEIKTHKEKLPLKYRHQVDQRIAKKVMALPEFTQAKAIFSYISIAEEPDTTIIIQSVLSSDKTLCFPKCCKDHQMKAIVINDLNECKPNSWGIPEPHILFEKNQPEQIDFAIIPWIAASPDGKRLGHGGGYYDRFLSRFTGTKCCLCYGQCLRNDMPVTQLDFPMDLVICETKIWESPD